MGFNHSLYFLVFGSHFAVLHILIILVAIPTLKLDSPTNAAITASAFRLAFLWVSLTVAIFFTSSTPLLLFVAIFLFFSIRCYTFFTSFSTAGHILVALFPGYRFHLRIFAAINSSSILRHRFNVTIILPLLHCNVFVAVLSSMFVGCK